MAHYTVERLDAVMTPSVWPRPESNESLGSVGDAYDNALVETLNGLTRPGDAR